MLCCGKTDPLGLSHSQKRAVQIFWNTFKQDIPMHANVIFTKFFKDFPEYIVIFTMSEVIDEDTIRDEALLQRHSIWAFNALSNMIENLMHNYNEFETTLQQIVKYHMELNVRHEQIVRLNEIILNYCKQLVRHSPNPKMLEGMKIIFTYIEEQFIQGAALYCTSSQINAEQSKNSEAGGNN